MSDLNLTEEWRPIVGYEGLYEVSDRGRIRARPKRAVGITGKLGRRLPLLLLTARADKLGYRRVRLSNRGEKRMHAVSRLVLGAFVGQCPPGMECCHGDGDRGNNHLRNLRWDTKINNAYDRRAHGTQAKMAGELHGNSKLTEEQVRSIRERRSRGETLAQLSADFGVTWACISGITLRKSWRHV